MSTVTVDCRDFSARISTLKLSTCFSMIPIFRNVTTFRTED